MVDHVTQWLSAYLDGELHGSHLQRVQEHLADCPGCQAELEALRSLSGLLHSEKLPEVFPTAERFASRVALRLPRREAPALHRATLELGWRLAPVGLLVAWVFVQAVVQLSGWVWVADQVGLLGEAAAWLAPASTESATLTGLFSELGILSGEPARQWAASIEAFGWSTLTQVILEGAVGLLFIGWLAVWWAGRKQRQLNG